MLVGVKPRSVPVACPARCYRKAPASVCSLLFLAFAQIPRGWQPRACCSPSLTQLVLQEAKPLAPYACRNPALRSLWTAVFLGRSRDFWAVGRGRSRQGFGPRDFCWHVEPSKTGVETSGSQRGNSLTPESPGGTDWDYV